VHWKPEATYEIQYPRTKKLWFNTLLEYWKPEARFQCENHKTKTPDSPTLRCIGKSCVWLRSHYERHRMAYCPILFCIIDYLGDFEYPGQNIRHSVHLCYKYCFFHWHRLVQFRRTLGLYPRESDDDTQPGYFLVYIWSSVNTLDLQSCQL